MPVVLCFGDSNTHGMPPMPEHGFKGRFGRDVRWPCVMARDLGAGWHLIEEGQNGRTTVHDDPIEGEHRNGRRILPAILESHAPVDVLVLMLGTNDLKQRFGVPGYDIALGAGKLVDMALASGAVGRVLLVSPPPVEERGCLAAMFAGASERGAGLAAMMAEVARQRGTGFFDAGSVIGSDPLDGVHFSAESHVALGHAMAQAVRDLMKELV